MQCNNEHTLTPDRRLDVKQRFTEEEQTIGFLKEAEGGMSVKELARKDGFCLWRSEFGGMEVPDAERLKSLESENARLKKLLAESMLEKGN